MSSYIDGLDDFEKKYPPDPVIGGEMDENARVWKVFRAEASAHDKRMLYVWNKSLDVHLLFAGLFSAVVVPFLMKSVDSLERSEPLVDKDDKRILRVNLLWFTSLFLALAAAFLAILCKQWLSEYSLRTTAPSDYAQQWARRRQVNSDGLSAGALPDVIAILPAILHLALLLFLGGLDAWLPSIDPTLSLLVGSLSSCVFAAYLWSTVVWIISESLFTTPMLRLGRNLITTVLLQVFQCICRACHGVVYITSLLKGVLGLPPNYVDSAAHADADDAFLRMIARCDRIIRKTTRQTKVPIQRMDATIEGRKDLLDASALHWLISMSDRNAAAVAIQAIGSLSPKSRTVRALFWANTYFSADEKVEILSSDRAATRALSTWTSTEIIRISRSLLCAGRLKRESLPPNMRHVLMHSDLPDARLLSGWMEDTLSALPITGSSPSFTSTFMLLLRSDPKNPRLLVSGLLSCELQAIDQQDWGIVFRSLRAYQQPNEPVVSSDSDLLPGQHTLSDMLLTVAERSDDFTPVAHKIIHRYLQLSAPEPVPFQPRLVRYTTSPTFLESAPEGFDSTALSRRLWLMSRSMLRVHAQYLSEMLQAILSAHRVQCDVRYAIRACTNVLAFQSAGPHVNPIAMIDRSRSPTASDASLTLSDPATTPSDTVVQALLPLLDTALCESYNREDVAFWTMLHEGGNVWALYPEEMCALAALLASALCAVGRTRKPTDPPIAGLVAAFSRGRSCFDLLRSRFLNEADRENVISLVRHCVELEPDFWNDASVRTRNQPVPPEPESNSNGMRSQAPLGSTSFVSDILNEVINAGPCRECRGAPVGWNNGPGGLAHNRCS